MTTVAVLLPTYGRREILKRTIQLLRKHIRDVDLYFIVGNDHEDEIKLRMKNVHVFNTPTGSLGANINRLLRRANALGYKYVLQLDDDHHLRGNLDLMPHIERLESDPKSGWIRLMQVAAHDYRARLDQDYWVIDYNSPELYVNSNRPHLKKLEYHTWAGQYPEGKKLGLTEEGFCHQVKAQARKDVKDGGQPRYDVLVPLTYDDTLWDHVGESWQGKGF